MLILPKQDQTMQINPSRCSYKVNMYQDIKFDEDPFAVGMGLNLKGIISKTEYRKAMQSVNQMLKKLVLLQKLVP